MGIHHISYRVTASGVDSVPTIINAITWLCGNKELINIDQTTSYYGSNINLITAKATKNKDIKRITELLTQNDLSKLSTDIQQRIDENNTLHFRLCLNSLVAQQIKLVGPELRSVKCNIKIESYPGQDSVANITKILAL